MRHPGHSRNTLRGNGNYVRYVRYADDVRSRNPVKTQNCENRRQQQRRRPKNRIENRDDDDDDNRWEAGGRGSVEISLENNPFSAGSGKTGEKREERGKEGEEEEVLTPRRIGGYKPGQIAPRCKKLNNYQQVCLLSNRNAVDGSLHLEGNW